VRGSQAVARRGQQPDNVACEIEQIASHTTSFAALIHRRTSHQTQINAADSRMVCLLHETISRRMDKPGGKPGFMLLNKIRALRCESPVRLGHAILLPDCICIANFYDKPERRARARRTIGCLLLGG
jgi:hypothetical protein